MVAFDLSSLIPEPLEFRDASGHTHEVRTTAMFGARDYATYRRLQTQMERVQALVDDAQAAEFERIVDEILTMIIPTLTGQLASIPFGVKAQFLNWWRAQQPTGETGKPTRQQSSPA